MANFKAGDRARTVNRSPVAKRHQGLEVIFVRYGGLSEIEQYFYPFGDCLVSLNGKELVCAADCLEPILPDAKTLAAADILSLPEDTLRDFVIRAPGVAA